ncbi:sodium-extruding oxaloacetate decarboxylase subunit alpha [Vibrio sp. SS-MA-C1-2]|uniref:sodium-extruding oxaloacetate decarboxylase subunit alpha n=1 Tax=Vibrio sp. SS-MA-C1-2 TaxID=2908646 RepID=UPI001F3BB15E|nr:sodium-extruding oxaloacetate decarboxylase subunit alpha [Vibrio sp. SS-MA-C1-2]UJF19009.1 sodium-extruding oxaloacetate decarboxylase subunit alpha [Vibrio sp. SS-MA-C1-2]
MSLHNNISNTPKQLSITDVVLRDAHQSLFATRMRIEDMLPIAEKLDNIGYWSLETWGGATFDACIRYLGEDPWERLRLLKKAMPKTPMQMLLRGQNLLGYRHYGDDVVTKFVERAHHNGMDIFRIFDAMNDVRNFQTSVQAVRDVGAHAQGAISYTTSPVHTLDSWVDLAKQLEDLGCDSLCIKDMSGLLKPYEAEALIGKIKASCDIPLALHCHATTGLSMATAIKAVEAGVDILDTAISSMSQTYGHAATESVVAMLDQTPRSTQLNLNALEPIADYFREVRKKYHQFEGQLKGIDSRILIAQVPGGMLTNMESQLKEQGAADKMDQVLAEIPKVRQDLGFIPLVTPTSQIVGTQAVINVLSGERYKSITKETAGILKGEYGRAPAELNPELQKRVLAGEEEITCRPADLIADELETLTAELKEKSKTESVSLADNEIDDVLTYALFPQVGLNFLNHRHNPDFFEPKPVALNDKTAPSTKATPVNIDTSVEQGIENYSVKVNGQLFNVEIGPQGAINEITEAPTVTKKVHPNAIHDAEPVLAPLTGSIFKVMVEPQQHVAEGEVLLILEAMKMETEVRAAHAGVVQQLHIKEGESVSVGSPLLTIT